MECAVLAISPYTIVIIGNNIEAIVVLWWGNKHYGGGQGSKIDQCY